MTRCKEFYDKWEKEPNWCEKCPDAVKLIDNYIKLTKELENLGIPKETTLVGLTERAARPLLAEKDPIVRDKVIESVKKDLESKKDASGKFVKKLNAESIEKTIKKIKQEQSAQKSKQLNNEIKESLTGRDAQLEQYLTCEIDNFDTSNIVTIDEPPASLQYTNLWEFTSCDPEFGEKNYPGRMPGQIIENLLWYYTKPFDVVLDPMAGGGTTVDVCKKMFRRCMAYDLNPIETKGIKKNDVTQGFPERKIKDKPRLIVLDPPYSIQKKGEYTKHETDLSNQTLDGFYKSVELLAVECKKELDKDGVVAYIISSLKSNGCVTDLAIDSRNIFVEKGFHVIERICVPYSHAASMTGYWISDAKKNKRMLRAYRDLLIMKVS